MIQNLISSPDTYAICQSIVESKYFSPEYTRTVTFIKEYYDKYDTTPKADAIKAETGIELVETPIQLDQIKYTCDEIEKFCQQEALKLAVMDSLEDIQKGDGAKLQERVHEAILISLHRELGLRYFDDPEARLQRMKEHTPVISTGLKLLDEALFGGYSRKELLLLSANSGGGKSITLSNLAFNAMANGLSVLYISLELSEDIVAQRFDTMFTGISRKNWEENIEEIVTGLHRAADQPNMGTLDIVQMKSGTTANKIRGYLKEFYLFHKTMPDVLVLDYVDKMDPNQTINASDVWSKDKYCTEQLRDIGVDYNMAILTASQLNREAINATSHNHSHIAGGISKINESDIYFSIMLDDIMRAQGRCEFRLQKTRNSDGVGKMLPFRWDAKYLRILDEEGEQGLFFNQTNNTPDKPPDASKNLLGNELLDFMTSTQG